MANIKHTFQKSVAGLALKNKGMAKGYLAIWFKDMCAELDKRVKKIDPAASNVPVVNPKEISTDRFKNYFKVFHRLTNGNVYDLALMNHIICKAYLSAISGNEVAWAISDAVKEDSFSEVIKVSVNKNSFLLSELPSGSATIVCAYLNLKKGKIEYKLHRSPSPVTPSGCILIHSKSVEVRRVYRVIKFMAAKRERLLRLASEVSAILPPYGEMRIARSYVKLVIPEKSLTNFKESLVKVKNCLPNSEIDEILSS